MKSPNSLKNITNSLRLKANNLLLWLLLFSAPIFAQERTVVVRVVSDSLPAVNVKVVNMSNEKTAVSNADGKFEILAKEDDLLVFVAENFEYKRLLLDAERMAQNVITVTLIPRGVILDEVVIAKDIDAETMGFVPKGTKRYTPAERKVYTATSGPVDIIANGLSGRTKMLKKGVAVEKKERLMERLDYQYEDDFYTGKLRIPSEYIKGFKFFLLDHPDVVKALELKNKPALLERISQLAPTYLELIAEPSEQPENK